MSDHKVYILFHESKEGKPQWNWIGDNLIGPWAIDLDKDWFFQDDTLNDIFDHDPRFEYKNVQDLSQNDKWIYVLQWYYDRDIFAEDSPMLDKFLSNPLLIDGLHKKLGFIAINLASECWYDDARVHAAESFMLKRNIPLDRVLFITGSINANDHFANKGYNIRPLVNLTFERIARNLAKEGHRSDIKLPLIKRFLSFNRIHRPHRLLLLSKLYEANLLDYFVISFSKYSFDIDILDYARIALPSVTPDYKITIESLEKLYPKLPMIVDTDNWTPNLANYHENNNVGYYYSRTGMSIVTETMFYEDSIFFSEKTFHPIRYCQPFIMLNSTGSLAELRNLGYKTFGNWIDESYDDIVDGNIRMQKIIDLISDIASWPSDKFSRFIDESRETCLHNLSNLMNNQNALICNNCLYDMYRQ